LLVTSPALAVDVPSRADVRRALERLVDGGAPGVTAVIRGPGGRERYSAGSANLRSGRPISPRDHGRVGSVAKSFTAALVLQLAAEGKLGLGDSVERWLPGVVPNGDRITVRQLLDHSSGIADYCGVPGITLCETSNPDPARRWTPEELVAIGVGAPPTFPPGVGWSYSNTDYVLLGMIIERATGRTLGAEYERRIFRPLGLDQTSYPTSTSMPRPFSRAYDVLGPGTWPPDVTATSPTIAGSAGAMVSTPGDLQTFMRALLRGRLLSRSLLREMQRPTPGSLDGDYALERASRAAQNELGRLLPYTRHVIARRSGHYIQNAQPELVTDAVRRVLRMVRPVAVRCRGGGDSCRARVSLAGGASNKNVVIRLSHRDLRLVSVRPNRRALRGAYGLSGQRLRAGGTKYVFRLNAAVDPPRRLSNPHLSVGRRLIQRRSRAHCR
jgi:D-alanyl-D-alanine carboxypeptidase